MPRIALIVFVIDQMNPESGKFDEHKVMLSFGSKKEAIEGYNSNYEEGWDGMRGIKEMSTDEFKSWLADGDTTKPIAKKFPKKKAASKKPANKAETVKAKTKAASRKSGQKKSLESKGVDGKILIEPVKTALNGVEKPEVDEKRPTPANEKTKGPASGKQNLINDLGELKSNAEQITEVKVSEKLKETEQGVVLFSKKPSDDGGKLSQDIDYNLPKNTIVGGAEEIGDLYDFALSREGIKKRAVRFGVVNAEEAQRIEDLTGIKGLTGFKHTVDQSGIRHADKSHGNESTETPRGYVPVKKNDFKRIPEIIKSPDSIAYGNKDRRGLDHIVYSKKFEDGVTYYVEEVREGKKVLILKSVWKARPGQRATSEDGFAQTSKTADRNSPHENNSISPKNTPVKNSDPDEEVYLSVNHSKPKGLPVADVEKIVQAISLQGAEVIVVKSVAQVPLDIATEGHVRGLYHPMSKKVYLFADNLDSKAEASKTLMHEVVGHYAMDAILGDSRKAIFDDIQQLKSKSAKFEGYAQEVKEAYGELAADEESSEIIALMAEGGIKNPLMTKVIAAVRSWLKKMGVKLPTSEVDIRGLILKAGDYVGTKKPRKLSMPVTSEDAVKFLKEVGSSYKKIPTNIADAKKAMSATGELLGDKSADLRPKWLAVMTRRHLEDLAKADLPAISRYVKTAQSMDAYRNELLSESSTLSEHWQKYIRENKAEADILAKLMHDTTIAGVDPSVDYEVLTDGKKTAHKIAVLKEKARGRSGSSTGPMMREIDDAKNLLKQEANRKEALPELMETWSKLSPEAQDIYRSVRDEYAARSEATLKVILERIDRYVENKSHRAKLKENVRLQFESARIQAPYFPLARFGDYWATSFKPDDEVAEMSMFETQGEQKKWIAEQESKGLRVTNGFKTTKGDMIRSIDSEFVMSVELMVDKSDNKDELKDSIYQFYLQTLPDLSMRKSFIHRKQTEGYGRDVLRAFSHQMFHGSYQLARMKHTPEMEGALRDAEKQVSKSGSPNRAAQFFNELQLRHEWAMNPGGAQWANNVSSLGFIMFLGLSPGAALVNVTQTPLVALPVLASKFGWAKSSKELLRAGKDYFAGGLNIENSLSGSEIKAYEKFVKDGLIDKTLAHDLAGIAEEGGEYSETRHRVMKVVSFLFHNAEKFNRDVTSIAAYRLAKKKGKSHESAMEMAEELTWESHYDYSSGNKARFMQDDKAKVIFMFRQFSLNMSYMLLRETHQSFKGESKEVRWEARKTIMGVLGMHFMLAGSMGMPLLFPALFFFANLKWDDEDEPWDAEVAFRQFMAEYIGDTGGRVIAHGPMDALTGMDFSSRVSLDGLWIRSPGRDLEGREVAAYWGGQLLGPMFGMAGNTMAGISMISEGKVQRGVETMLPKGIKDGFKALRYAEEGVNNYRGDPLIEKLDGSELFWQAMGIAPARVGEQYDKNRYVKNKERKILDRKKTLLNKFALSVNQSDDDLRDEAIKGIRRFNSKNPRVMITMDSLMRSMKMRKLYSAKSLSGINLTDKLRYIADEVDY